MHPYNVVGFFIVFINLNFLYIFNQVGTGNSVNFARSTISTVWEVTAGMGFFLALTIAMVGGIFLASAGRVTATPVEEDLRLSKAGKLVFWICAAMAAWVSLSVIGQSLSRGSLFYIAGIRQAFFRENAVFYVMLSLLAPATIVAIAWQRRDRSRFSFWLIPLVAIGLLLPLGSRGALLYVLIALMTAAAVNGRKIRAIWMYLGSPVVALILVLLRYFREGSSASFGFGQYLDVNSQELLFGNMDFSTAEPIVLSANYDMIQRQPWDSLLAMLVAPLPRSMVPWKPEGASAAYSAAADPQRWVWTQSEFVITGFANLKVELGIAGAIFSVFVLSALWAGRLRRASQSGPHRYALTAVLLTLSAYIFIRGDLYNLALFLWPVAIVLTGRRFIAGLFRGDAKRKKDVVRTPALVLGQQEAHWR